MRAITPLLIALCILAAAALPKAHHATHYKPTKVVEEVENDLDEASDEDLQATLEEEDEVYAEPHFEEDSDDEVVAEEKVEKVEKVEDELEEDDDEDEAQTKVADDITLLKHALEESDLPSHTRKEASDNLNKIGEDVRELKTATAHRATALKKAIQSRLEAFHMMIDKNDEPEMEEEEEDDAVSRIDNDVHQLEEAVETSDISKADKKQAFSNLEAIAKDAHAFSEASSTKAKELFREAIGKRMKALHMMLEETHEDKHVEQATKVVDDVHHIQTALKKAHVPVKAKKAITENLSHILKDAEEISEASGARRSRLGQAMKLRSKALRQQLEEM